MRILHVINGVDSRAGGPTVAMAGLCKAQRKAGLDVSVFATVRAGEGRDLADDLVAQHVPVTSVGPAQGALANHPDLNATLRRAIADADVIHAHGIWEQVQHSAATISREAGKPYVITPHGMLTPWSLHQKWLKKKLYMMLRLRRDLNSAAAIHFTSSAAEREATAALRLKPAAIVEPLGLNLNDFEPLPVKGEFRAKFPAIGDRKIILFLGRVHPGKGLEYLIPAFKRSGVSDAVLVAVGPDSQGFIGMMQSLAKAEGIDDQLIFAGMLRGRDKLAALIEADLFALPSEHENFGIVVLESLACGTPVIVSDGVALHGEVAAGGVGAVVPARDVNALALELKRWLDDPSLRAAASAKARNFVEDRFAWDRIAQHWVNHYTGLRK